MNTSASSEQTPDQPMHVEFDMQDKDDETRNTHLWLVNRATEMASEAGPVGAALADLMRQHAARMHQGLWDADNAAPYNDPIAGVASYASHFYDPTTGLNYLKQADPTALTRGRQFFDAALDYYWDGDQERAVYFLGLSLHYITDCSQPMHAVNFTNLDIPLKYHAGFEEYVITWLNAHPQQRPAYQQTLTFSSAD